MWAKSYLNLSIECVCQTMYNLNVFWGSDGVGCWPSIQCHCAFVLILDHKHVTKMDQFTSMNNKHLLLIASGQISGFVMRKYGTFRLLASKIQENIWFYWLNCFMWGLIYTYKKIRILFYLHSQLAFRLNRSLFINFILMWNN